VVADHKQAVAVHTPGVVVAHKQVVAADIPLAAGTVDRDTDTVGSFVEEDIPHSPAGEEAAASPQVEVVNLLEAEAVVVDSQFLGWEWEGRHWQ